MEYVIVGQLIMTLYYVTRLTEKIDAQRKQLDWIQYQLSRVIDCEEID